MKTNWFNKAVDETISTLKTDIEKGLSVDEIVKNLENLKNDIEVIFSVDTLEYLNIFFLLLLKKKL